MRSAPNEFDKSLGKQLALLRLMRGLSQTQLGKQLGITFQQVQKYERGTNKVSFERILQLCRIFNVPLEFWVQPSPMQLPSSIADLFEERATIFLVQAYNRIKNAKMKQIISSLAHELASCQ